MDNKPNIFQIATKELSQDGFITWLIRWAHNNNEKYNKPLNETAKEFVRYLIKESNNYQITKVVADRQWNNIDIVAQINDKYFIAIEDKTNTGEHSEQLIKYKEVVTNEYKGRNYKLVFIYLKTGNESIGNLKEIENKGYSIVSRKDIINILNIREVQNDIFLEFRDNLISLERLTNDFTKLDNILTDSRTAEGFYLKLQERLGVWSHWEYVPNKTGGFLGFWYHLKVTSQFNLYIQIENGFNNGIKLVVKISEYEPSINLLYQIINDLQPYSEKYKLTLTKPIKYRVGNTSTLAVVPNAFTLNDEGEFDIEYFIQTLRTLEMVLNEYTENLVLNQATY